MKVARIFGREVTVWVVFLTTMLMALSLSLDWSQDEQGAANLIIVSVGGVVTAILVRSEDVLPMVVGAIKAVFAGVLAFGLDVDPKWQVVTVIVVEGVGALFVRQQVGAPVQERVVIGKR